MALQPVTDLAPASNEWGRELVNFAVHGIPGMPDLGFLFSFACFVGFWLALWAMQTLTHRAGVMSVPDALRLVQRLCFGSLAMVFLVNGSVPLMADVRPWMTSVLLVVIIDVVLGIAVVLNQPYALIETAIQEIADPRPVDKVLGRGPQA